MSGDVHAGRPECPDAEQLAVFVDGHLPEAMRLEVVRHLATCEACRDTVGLAASLPDPEGSVAYLEMRHRPWLMPATLVTLAAAAALLFAVVLPQRWAASERLALLQTVSAARTAEPRLTTMEAHEAPPPIARDGAPQADATLDIRIAEAELQQWAEKDPSVANLHAFGIARMAVRDYAGAVRALERAVARSNDDAVRVDLAAALLAEGYRQEDPIRIERARGLIGEVLARDPAPSAAVRDAARFNAALAAEYLGDRDEAIAAWERYLAGDADSPWAAEARARLDRLR